MWRTSETCYHWLKTCGKEIFLQEPIHQRCKWSVKTINHGVLEYKVAKKIWFQAPFTVQSVNVQFQDMLNTIQEMATNMRKANFELMVLYSSYYSFFGTRGALKRAMKELNEGKLPHTYFCKETK